MLDAVVESPDSELISEWVRKQKTRSGTIGLFVRCEVVYDGRASSELATGDRFILFKPDGSFVVHTDSGCDPQNWMPPGGKITIKDTNPLTIRVRRSEPVEVINIVCDHVYFGGFMQIEDDAELKLQGSERDLQEYVYENPEVFEEGFRPEEMEKETNAGPVDIWGYDSDGRPVLLELKRRTGGPDDVEQLQRYLNHINADTRGVLIAPSFSDRAIEMLNEHGLEYKEIEPPSSGRNEHRSLSEFTGDS